MKPAVDKFILVTLCNWANDEWEAYPSIKTMEEKTGLDRKTIIAGYARLVAIGAIMDSGDRKGRTKQIPVWRVVKEYRIRNSTENGTVPYIPDNSPICGTVKESHIWDTDTKELPYTKEDTKDKEPSPPSKVKNDYPADFESVWTAYPKKGGSKKAAFQAWNARVRSGATPEEIHAGVMRYAKQCAALGKENGFIKDAETFFGPKDYYKLEYAIDQQKQQRRPGVDAHFGLPATGSYGQGTQLTPEQIQEAMDYDIPY